MNNLPQSEPTVCIGRWEISWVPAGWQFIPDFGIRQIVPSGPSSNVGLGEDDLLAGSQLALYVHAQIAMLKQQFQSVIIAGPGAGEFPGAEEAMLLMLKHHTVEGIALVQVQHYVRQQTWIGIVTLTALEQELLNVRKDYENFTQALRIRNPTE